MVTRLKHRRHVRKVGYQIPEHVLELMAIRHPTVQILWEPRLRRWALVQFDRGGTHFIGLLGTPKRYQHPTIQNTVVYLDRIHPRRFRSEFQKQRFLNQLDRNPLEADVKRRASDAIRQGSIDLFNRINGRKVLRMRG